VSTLHYDSPAASWLEALPLGNGSLGAMCWGGVGTARFDLNEQTVWSGSPASERAQIPLDAAGSAEVLARSRKFLAEADAAQAGAELMKMQSAYGQAYLPLGTLEVSLVAHDGPVDVAGGSYRRELDLTRAFHTVLSDIDGATVRHRTLISARHRVLVHMIDGLPDGVGVHARISTSLRVTSTDSHEPSGTQILHVLMPSDVAPTHEPNFAPITYAEDEESLAGAVVVRVVENIAADGARRVVVVLAASTTYDFASHGICGTTADAEDRARTWVDAAIADGADAVTDAHLKDHALLFNRVVLDLGTPDLADEPIDRRLVRAATHPGGVVAADPALAALLFDYGRYLLIACSRAGGLPATLQGIWNDSMQPPWSSSYTLNINFQMNYWAAEPANLSETAWPVRDFVAALAERSDSAARLYGARGWAAHHNSDAWLATSPVGAGHGDPSWAFWPMAGPWLVRSLWDGVEFGSVGVEDIRTLLWPVIRSAAEFALDWMVQLPDGSWGTSPSTSPENTYVGSDGGPVSVGQSSAMDIELLRDLFGIVADAARILGLESDPIAQRVAARLVVTAHAPVVGEDGTVREWGTETVDVDPRHRHVSHLYALYPGPGISDPAVLEAVRLTLDRRGDDSTGWSLAWKLALWARLGEPGRVSDLLRLVFRTAGSESGPWAGGLYPNLFAAHPPFQIDGNLGYVAAVVEMLVQSHRGEVHLLPALPSELAGGVVTGLVARPGLEVAVSWRGGVLVDATLKARRGFRGGTVVVRYGDRTVRVSVFADTPATVTRDTFMADTFTTAAIE
jgi:alpha-L-fucosidase 2